MNEQLKYEEDVPFKHIIRITYPVILSMFSLNIMVFVDRAFVAKYNLTQFSATMPASNLATTIASIFIGIVGFVSPLVSQYYGAQRHKECPSPMWQGVYLSVIFSVLLLIITPVASNIFKLMGHTGELLKYERQYFYFIILTSCVILFSTTFSSFFRGIGDTKTTMFVGVIINIINILFDWVFIYGKLGMPQMGGIFGSGISTLLSNIIGVIIYICLLSKKNFKNEYDVSRNFKLDKPLMRKLLGFGFPAGIQSFVGTGYFSLLLLIIGKTGVFNLSCSNIAFTIEGISIFPVWGLGTAVSIIAAQEMGAGRIENVIKVVKKGILIGLCFNLIIIALYNFFPGFLISIFSSGTDKEKYLQIINYTIPLVRFTSIWIVFDTIQIIIGYVLRSLGDSLFMMITYLVVPFLFYIIFPYLIVMANISLIWIWIELVIFTVCMLIIVSTRFLGGQWKKINVI